MTHFRATIQGNRGEASRLGSKPSGIKATVNGWDIGTSIYAEHSELLQSDLIRVHFTGGSNSRTSYGSITVTLKDGKFAVVDTSFPEVLI